MEIKQFLQSSYTAYHAVQNVAEYLAENGFTRLFTDGPWKLNKGGKYFVIKNGSTLAAFVVGDLSDYAFNIVESHTDSPALKVKGNALVDSPEGKRINTEKYGGGLLYSMLDIPLKVAGRAVFKSGGRLVPTVVTSGYNVNIPSMCIHHAPENNDSLKLNVQVDMLPLLGEAQDLYSTLSDGEIADADLFVVPDVAPFMSGANSEYLVSPRIDNLTSVFSATEAIVKASPRGVAISVCFDNEEVGSLTKQGANGAFLPDLLKKINSALGKTEDDFRAATENGFVVSADNGHAVHPAHPEKSDVCEKVFMGGGVVIKHHVNYSTDGVSSAIAKAVLSIGGVKYQEYYNRSDMRCGGTLGLISSSQLAMNACDVGIAQLAMHSAVETACLSDVDCMTKFMTAFFDCSINVDGDGAITVK